MRHRRVGEHAEQDAAVDLADGTTVVVPAPEDARGPFAELRRAQVDAGEPRWYSARVSLSAPDDGVTVDTDVGEPGFTGAEPSPADYLTDAARLPGEDPPWLGEVTGAAGVAAGGSRTLAGLGLPGGAVRFGGPARGDGRRDPAHDATDDDVLWRVLRRDARWVAVATEPVAGSASAMFDDPRDAAAFAIGRVVLTGGRPTSVHRAGGPFTPRVDDPPLSLFRDLRVLVLGAGSVLERRGCAAGTVVFLAGTPSPATSLPPELADREVTRWRVHRPVEVLAGTSVPWFGQPGGGAAAVLPAPLAELVAAGVLAAELG